MPCRWERGTGRGREREGPGEGRGGRPGVDQGAGERDRELAVQERVGPFEREGQVHHDERDGRKG